MEAFLLLTGLDLIDLLLDRVDDFLDLFDPVFLERVTDLFDLVDLLDLLKLLDLFDRVFLDRAIVERETFLLLCQATNDKNGKQDKQGQ